MSSTASAPGAQLTILFVTHNVREAVRLGDRVVVLSSRPGRVVDEFPVPIEHPRRIDSAPVAELAGQITDRLREEMSHGDPVTSGHRCRPTRSGWRGLSRSTAETPADQRGRRLLVRGWAALWPKLLAIAIVLVIWQLIARQRLEEGDLPGSGGGPWLTCGDQLQTSAAVARHRDDRRSAPSSGSRSPW